MKILRIFFFIFFAITLSAHSNAVQHPYDSDPVGSVNQDNGYDSSTVSMEEFYQDTLRNDSFFKANYARYYLPKKQLPPDPDIYFDADSRPIIKPMYRRDWIFLIVIGILMLLLFIKFNFSKLYRNAISSLYKRSATAELINDKYSPRWLFVLFSNLFFVLIISLWAYRNFIRLEEPLYEEKFDVFVTILSLILVVYIIKFLVHLLAGLIFQIREAIAIYIINISITNLFCGVFMLFITLLLLYSPWHGQQWLITTSMGIIAFFILLRYFRGLSQTMQYFKYNYLYLILYLCTLEIAPWFLIIKYLNNYL